jgi:hypothetical protein
MMINDEDLPARHKTNNFQYLNLENMCDARATSNRRYTLSNPRKTEKTRQKHDIVK